MDTKLLRNLLRHMSKTFPEKTFIPHEIRKQTPAKPPGQHLRYLVLCQGFAEISVRSSLSSTIQQRAVDQREERI